MIGWPRTLSWGDFQAIPNPGPGQLVALNRHPIVARVALGIMFQPASSPMVADGGQYRFQSVDVRLVFSPTQMQYVPSRIPHGMETRYLRHEQGHVDLMGLFAREMEVELLALRAANSVALLAAANAAVDESVRSARMYAINRPGEDCMYDLETEHGMNHRRQAEWNSRIERNIAHWRDADFHFRT